MRRQTAELHGFLQREGKSTGKVVNCFFLSLREVCVRHPRMVRARCRSSHDLLNGKG